MISLFPSASLKRSIRARSRKNSISTTTDIMHSPRSSSLSHRKTRPPPLQIIPELSENDLFIDVSPSHSPMTARPMQFSPQQLQVDTSRVTLSAYTFSIDDALLMFGDEAPGSPALSASSSTTGTSSEGVLATPGTSDDEDEVDIVLSVPRLRPHRISIRPLCITKTRSLVCQEGEDILDCFEKEGEEATVLSPTETEPEAGVEESVLEFYLREFEDFVSLSPIVVSHSSPARRDSLILSADALSIVKAPEPRRQGRSRHSKPLPLLPPATPPISALPSISSLPERKSIVRRKRNVPPLPDPSSPHVESRPLPRTSVPEDVEDFMFPGEDFDVLSRRLVINKDMNDAEDDVDIPSLACTPFRSTHPLPPAIPETPLAGMYGEVALPRSSIDSDAPRSSIDSATSFVLSSSNTDAPFSPFSFPPSTPTFESHEGEGTERLRSRWSSSTLGSVIVEPSRPTLLSPFKNVFGSRVRWVPVQKAQPQPPPQHVTSPRSKRGNSTTVSPSPPRSLGKHIRRQGSRSSTFSSSTGSSECENQDGLSGLKRMPIPVTMFLRGST